MRASRRILAVALLLGSSSCSRSALRAPGDEERDPSACLASGAACASAAECCAAGCLGGACATPVACGAKGQPCATAADCCSGRCESGTCAGAFSPGEPPIALATAIAGPFNVALDDAFVYFTSYVKTGAVLRVPKAGGPATTLTSGDFPHGIAVDAADAFVAEAGGGRIAMDDAFIYFVGAALTRVSKDGSGAIVLASDSDVSGTGIAVDASFVYWTSPAAGTVMKMPKAGGETVALASGQDTPSGLAIDDDCAYFTTNALGPTGSVMKVAK